jgi:hypothetical protein
MLPIGHHANPMPEMGFKVLRRTYKVRVEQDYCAESPCDMDDGWKVHSFSHRHVNYKHPDTFGIVLDEYGEGTSTELGIRNKLRAGTMMILSCYQHGGVVWSLEGSGPQCRFDTASVAGIIEVPKDIPMKDRHKAALAFLNIYNDWCNGEVYCISAKGPDGERDYLGWIYGSDLEYSAREFIKNLHGLDADAEFDVELKHKYR